MYFGSKGQNSWAQVMLLLKLTRCVLHQHVTLWLGEAFHSAYVSLSTQEPESEDLTQSTSGKVKWRSCPRNDYFM